MAYADDSKSKSQLFKKYLGLQNWSNLQKHSPDNIL